MINVDKKSSLLKMAKDCCSGWVKQVIPPAGNSPGKVHERDFVLGCHLKASQKIAST